METILQLSQPKSQTDLKPIIVLMHALDENAMRVVGRSLQSGHVKRLKDEELNSTAIELFGANFQNNFIYFPERPDHFLKIPADYKYLCLYVKNMNKPFSIDFSVLDSSNNKIRFRLSTLVNLAKLKPFFCIMPLKLDDGWNKICIDLPSICKRAFKTSYRGLLRLQVNANCRIRRIFVSQQNFSDEFLHNKPEIWTDSIFETEQANDPIKM